MSTYGSIMCYDDAASLGPNPKQNKKIPNFSKLVFIIFYFGCQYSRDTSVLLINQRDFLVRIR